MGDMGNIFRDMREERRKRAEVRYTVVAPFVERLRARSKYDGILPGGFRFVFVSEYDGDVMFDYWPKRGKWCEHGSGRQHHRQGEASLLRRLEELGVEHERIEQDDAGLRRYLRAA